MSQEKPSTLLTLVTTIERTCRAHVSVAQFDYGDLTSFNDAAYQYPLAYLETVQDLQENANGSEHTYTVALNLADLRRPLTGKDTQTSTYLEIQDRLSQIFFEIKDMLQTDYLFSKERVGAADILIFTDYGTDQTIRVRGEFTVEVESISNKTADLLRLFPGLLAT